MRRSYWSGAHVLELVDDEAAVLAVHLGGDVLVRSQGSRQDEQDVLEVEHPALRLQLGVAVHDARHRVDVHAFRERTAPRPLRVVVDAQQADRGVLDLCRDVADRLTLRGDAHRLHGVSDDSGLLREEIGERPIGHPRPEVAQLPQRGGVEGPRLHAGDAQGPQPRSHLARRLRREGECEDLARIRCPDRRLVRDAVGDGAGLARPRPGEHHQRPARVLSDLALLRIESGEQDVVGRHRGVGAVSPSSHP